MKTLFTKNSWILFGIFAAGFLIGGLTMWSQITFTKEVVKTMDEKIEVIALPDMKKWKCHQVETCRAVDWRYYDPKDACTYYDEIISFPTDPANHPSYGAYCEEI